MSRTNLLQSTFKWEIFGKKLIFLKLLKPKPLFLLLLCSIDGHKLILTYIKVIYILVTHCQVRASGSKVLWFLYFQRQQLQNENDNRPRSYSPRRRYSPSPLPPPASRLSLPDLMRHQHYPDTFRSQAPGKCNITHTVIQ